MRLRNLILLMKDLRNGICDERARTAQWWLILSTPNGKVVPENILKDRAGWYLSQAQSIHTYMITLISESGSHPQITGGAADDIASAQQEMERVIMSARYLIHSRQQQKQAHR